MPGVSIARPHASATATSPPWRTSRSRSQPGELVALLGPVGLRQDDHAPAGGGLPHAGGRARSGSATAACPRRRRVVPPERRRMAMIFQSYALWPHMTVAQNVAYGLRFKRGPAPRRPRPARDARCCGSCSSPATRRAIPASSRGGQQQRVAVARALVVEPEILLLDEPLSNLDANLREEMRFEIRRLHEAFGITTLYVTHDQAEAMVISDRIAVLERGRVAQVGTADEVFRPAAHALRRRVHRPHEPASTAWPPRPDTVAVGRLRLRVAGTGLAPGRPGGRVDPPARRSRWPSRWTTPRAGVNALRGTVQARELPRRQRGLPGRARRQRRRAARRGTGGPAATGG